MYPVCYSVDTKVRVGECGGDGERVQQARYLPMTMDVRGCKKAGCLPASQVRHRRANRYTPGPGSGVSRPWWIMPTCAHVELGRTHNLSFTDYHTGRENEQSGGEELGVHAHAHTHA